MATFTLIDPQGQESPSWCPERKAFLVWSQTRYLVELAEGAPRAPFEHLPRALFRFLTDRLGELNFGNFAGRAQLAGVDLLVRSATLVDHEPMLRDVTRAISQLPFTFNTPVAQAFEDVTSGDMVLYHQWLQLWTWVEGLDDQETLSEDFGRISYDPHRRLSAETHEESLDRVRDVGPATFQRMMSNPGDWCTLPAGLPLSTTPLARAFQQLGGRSVLPERVATRRVLIAIDTPENRFVKHVLNLAADINRRFQAVLTTEASPYSREIVTQTQQMASSLTELLAAPWLADVGEMQVLPTQSMVLQRKDGYRGFLRGYSRLQSGIAFPIAPDDLARIVGLKDAATLYEYWTYFQLAQALESRLGPPARALVVIHRETHSYLPQETRLEWTYQGHPLTLSYNRTFLGGRTDQSYSVRLRPDATLEWNGQRLIFDAKFKLDGIRWDDDDPDVERAAAKKEDIYKMHTYREAIERVQAAYVLYPGTAAAVTFYRADEERHGIGAIPCRPGDSSEALEKELGRALEAMTVGHPSLDVVRVGNASDR